MPTPAPRSPAVVVLELLDTVHEVIRSSAVAEAWHRPSVLAEYTVGELAGHACRSLVVVERALDEPADPTAEVIDAAAYFVVALGDHDPVDSDLHRGARARSAELAGGAPDALERAMTAGLERLRPRLLAADLDATVPALGGLVLTMREYLATRIVELCVHLDDLALSAGTTATVPDDAGAAAVAVLAEVMRRRHGDVAALRVLARRERADPDVRAL